MRSQFFPDYFKKQHKLKGNKKMFYKLECLKYYLNVEN